MKSRIESMGPINMMALEEYNECEQRFGFLGRERADLLQSITDTQQAITELDQVCKQKFEEAFAVINTQFRHGLPHALRRRHRRDAAFRAGQLGRAGHRRGRAAAGQAPAERAAAFRRRKSA